MRRPGVTRPWSAIKADWTALKITALKITALEIKMATAVATPLPRYKSS